MKIPTVAIMIVSTPVLAGRLADCHAPYLARRLYDLGAELGCIEFLPSEVEAIARSVRPLSESFDLVLTVGGLGAGPDDQTMAGLARAFDRQLIRHTFLENLISHRFEGREIPAARARMAEVPDEARILVRSEESPPQVVVRNIYPLPGAPERLHPAFENLADLFQGVPRALRRIRIQGEEPQVVPFLNRIVRLCPGIRLGVQHSDPEAGRIHLTLESRDSSALEQACEELLNLLPPDMDPLRIE